MKIEGKDIDESQELAAVANDKNICVNAGAGSGKTLTIIAKIIHLLENNLALPKDILLLAYNKEVAEELTVRIRDLSKHHPHLKPLLDSLSEEKGALRRIHTFHSFGLYLLTKNNPEIQVGYKDTNDSKIGEVQKYRFIEMLIEELMLSKKNFGQKVIKYFATEFFSQKNIFKDIKTMSDYHSEIKPRLISLKTQKDGDFYYNISVRSKQELEIANYLYLKGIEFKYEDPYLGELPDEWTDKNKNYKPDFHLFKKNKDGTVEYDYYYEHFGLDKNLKPPNYFSHRDKEKYIENYNSKIKLHGPKLIKTFSYEKYDGTLFKNLDQQLIERGIKIPDDYTISSGEAIENFKKAGYFNIFAKDITRFLENFLLREFTLGELQHSFKSNWFKNLFETYENKRIRIFIELFSEIYLLYSKRLKEDRRVYFEEMLIECRKYLNNYSLKYLIVDEFQDISPLRSRIIQKLKMANPDMQFFCVGDDWQSIYRFSGSEIKIIVSDFKDYFGDRKIINLSRTYRFNKILTKISSSFILKNKDGQLFKEIEGLDNDEIPLEIFHNHSDKVTCNFSLKFHVVNTLHKIFKNDSSVKRIFFLARYNDFTYRDQYKNFEKYLKSIFSNKKDIIQFQSIHKAKGAEADYVFLMNIQDGKLGFPSDIEDDPILKIVTNNEDDFEYEEERRLFYVALTRAKKRIFLYGSQSNYLTNEIYSDEQLIEGLDYKKDNLPELPEPKKLLEVSYVRGKKGIISAATPFKNNSINVGSQIIQINDIKNPDLAKYRELIQEKKDIYYNFKIKFNDQILNYTMKPYNQNHGTNKRPFYGFGVNLLEKELDPFIEKITNIYKL